MISEAIDNISKGALTCILNNGIVQDPVVQVLGIEKISTEGKVDKYVLNLSDSLYFYQKVVMASKLNHLLSSDLVNFSIVKIKDYVVTYYSESSTKTKKRVLVILDLVVLASGNDVGLAIGNPVPVNDRNLKAGIIESILTTQTFEVHELLKGLKLF